jgi:hypothetical protein
MKNKKWLLLLIIALPSLLWILLETSTINSYKLNYYGPKKGNGKDTVFYKVPDVVPTLVNYIDSSFRINKEQFPVYAMMFVNESYKNEAYRLAGLWEYLNYKKEKISAIPFFIACKTIDGNTVILDDLKKIKVHENVKVFAVKSLAYDSLNKVYFNNKPYYVDYSFFVLVDRNRNIRGYYDSRYASEIKRLADEYQHLRLKEEKQLMINENEIRQN